MQFIAILRTHKRRGSDASPLGVYILFLVQFYFRIGTILFADYSCSLDTGLIYSNPQMRESVIVVALASSKEQLENSLRHECQHLVIHIANTCGIDLQSEELCYLAGEIAMLLYPVSHKLTCACDGT